MTTRLLGDEEEDEDKDKDEEDYDAEDEDITWPFSFITQKLLSLIQNTQIQKHTPNQA